MPDRIHRNVPVRRPLSKLLVDGGDPEETKSIRVLGFVDGQTTNPSLITKNPKLRSS